MTIANVALTDTFDLWRTRFNQSVTYLNTFASNTLSLVSNSATLTISGTGKLGSNVYFDIGTLSTNVLDQAVGNIASANSVYTAYNITYTAANTAQYTANLAFHSSNTAQYTANLAFNKANTAYNQANVAGGGYYRGNNGDAGNANNKNNLFRINYNFLGANIGFDDGENAITTGPITINTGSYLIINTGARVVIA